MAQLKKYDLDGKEVGTITVEDSLLDIKANGQMVKDYLVAIRNNARQWSANTKTRSEVAHSGQKPHRQKGTGRARQGCLAAAQYKGGGIVFGPKPKFDQHTAINKKEKRSAIRYLLAEKIKNNNLHILCGQMDAPKTKVMQSFLTGLSLDKKRVLFLTQNSHLNVVKSVRNLQKKQYTGVARMNGYNLACAQDIVLMESAVEELLAILGKGSKHD